MRKPVLCILYSLLATLLACAGPSRSISYRQDRDLYGPLDACTYGPFPLHLLGPIEAVFAAGNLQVVRRRVPAGVAAPTTATSLVPNTFDIASAPTDRWLYGLDDDASRCLFPCIYDQVVVANGNATAYHRIAGNLFQSAASAITDEKRIRVEFGSKYDYDDPYSSHQIAVLHAEGTGQATIAREMRIRRDGLEIGNRRWNTFRGVRSNEPNPNDSDYPTHLASHHARVVGLEDSLACLNRHVWPNRHGVWFAAPRGNAGTWQLWFWAIDTGEVTEHDDVRCIVRRSEQDHRALPLLVRAAPNDPQLLWPWHDDTRQFAPPAGTAGLVPLTFQVTSQLPIYNLLIPTPMHGDAWKEILLTTGYSTTIDEFLVAYDVGGARRWGTMNRELEEATGPIYARVEFRRSPELERRVRYRPEFHGTSQWVLAQRLTDGAWSIGHGRVAARAESFLPEPPERLVAAAEAMVADRNREEFRKLRVYEDAQRAATEESQQRELLRKEQQAAAAAEQARLAKVAAERAAVERANAPTGGSGGTSGGDSYAQWHKSTWASIEANQRGLTGSAFSGYMDRHGR